jgi:methylthioribose-1-phosphate isomerase
MKADLLNQFKADLEPIKSELLRMQGRIEEAGASKGSMDRALARELKMLSIIDQRLAGIEAKLPTATEAAEIIRQIQPPQVRTTPPRTEEEKAAAYREAIRKLEEEAQKEKAEAKEAPEPKPEAKKTNKPKTT